MAMIRKILISIAVLLISCLSFLVIMAVFFSSRVDEWLWVNQPVEAEVLIIEGWTPADLVDEVASEFNRKEYKKLITTGGPLDDAYNMAYDGMIRFDLQAAGVTWEPGDKVTISLWAFGEPADGINARYTIVHGEDTIARDYTSTVMEEYRHHFKLEGDPAGEIFVIYDNDHITRDEDRNLHVWKIETGGVTIPVRSDYTRLIRRVGSGILDRPLSQKTLAEEKAFQLTMAGIDHDRIIAVEVPPVERLRTFTDAVMVSEWFRNTGYIPRGVNLFSQGTHARRSRLLYSYALPGEVEVGIIASGPASADDNQPGFPDFNPGTIRELGAYIHTRFFFNAKRQYRRIVSLTE
jgi:hypothetical protein